MFFSLQNLYDNDLCIPIMVNEEISLHSPSSQDPGKLTKKDVYSSSVMNRKNHRLLYGYGDDHYIEFAAFETITFSYAFHTRNMPEKIVLKDFMLPENKPYGRYSIRISVKDQKLETLSLKKKYTDFLIYEPDEETAEAYREQGKDTPDSGIDAVICPCCGETVGPDEVRHTLDREVQILGGWARPRMENLAGDYYHWACDACLDSGRALEANHDNFDGVYGIYLAFYDIEKTCKSCHQKYIFTKEEQRHWFEELKFCHRAKSVRCIPCRKEIRHQNHLNKRLTEMVPRKKTLSPEEIKEVIDIYVELDKPEKTPYYVNILKKLQDQKKQ